MAPCRMCARLAKADHFWETPHSVTVLADNQAYLGYCVVIARRHAKELFDLDRGERTGFMEDMTRVAAAQQACFSPVKINYEILGNWDPHVHAHVIPRYPDDPAAGDPVWTKLDAKREAPSHERASLVAKLRASLVVEPDERRVEDVDADRGRREPARDGERR